MDDMNKQEQFGAKKCGCGKGCGCGANPVCGNGGDSGCGSACGSTCGKGFWYGGHHLSFHLLRWVLGVIIILLAFSLGLKVGEFKSELENMGHSQWGYARHQPMMLEYSGYGTDYGMMDRGVVSNGSSFSAATLSGGSGYAQPTSSMGSSR